MYWNSICRPGWPWICRDLPASASRVLGFKAEHNLREKSLHLSYRSQPITEEVSQCRNSRPEPDGETVENTANWLVGYPSHMAYTNISRDDTSRRGWALLHQLIIKKMPQTWPLIWWRQYLNWGFSFQVHLGLHQIKNKQKMNKTPKPKTAHL